MKIFRSDLLQVLILSIVFASIFIPARAGAAIENLKVEYCKTPLGIDVKTPRFNS